MRKYLGTCKLLNLVNVILTITISTHWYEKNSYYDNKRAKSLKVYTYITIAITSNRQTTNKLEN